MCIIVGDVSPDRLAPAMRGEMRGRESMPVEGKGKRGEVWRERSDSVHIVGPSRVDTNIIDIFWGH